MILLAIIYVQGFLICFPTFFEIALVNGLSFLKYGLHEDPHGTLRRVDPSNHAKSQSLLARSLFELDCMQRHGQTFGPRSGRDVTPAVVLMLPPLHRCHAI